MEYLRDDNVDTFWQSDGTQPHLVNVQFQRKVRIAEVVLYVDYRNDESYTPQKVRKKVSSRQVKHRGGALTDPLCPFLRSLVRAGQLQGGQLVLRLAGDQDGGAQGAAGLGGHSPGSQATRRRGGRGGGRRAAGVREGALPADRGPEQPPERQGYPPAAGQGVWASGGRDPIRGPALLLRGAGVLDVR